MIVLNDIFCGYYEDPATSFHFERFAHEADDFYLAVGGVGLGFFNTLPDNSVIYAWPEEPNGFYVADRFICHPYAAKLKKVLTICPYTAGWSNARFPGDKWESTFIPFNEELIPPPGEKKYDLIYSGLHHCEVPEVLGVMRDRSHVFVHFTAAPHVTHAKITYKEKIALYAQSKIAVVHNLLYPDDAWDQVLKKDSPAVRAENQAFERVRAGEGIVPQLKSRLFEAAFCRSLIVCRRDPWNLVERFFEPGKEFVYYEPGKLAPVVADVLAHYNDYLPIVEAAFERAATSYTTRHYFDKHLKDVRLGVD